AGSAAGPDDAAAVAQLRLDLAEAFRAKAHVQARADKLQEEAARLRARADGDRRAVVTLTAERNTLARKVRDRDDELQQKSRMLEVRTYIPLPSWPSAQQLFCGWGW